MNHVYGNRAQSSIDYKTKSYRVRIYVMGCHNPPNGLFELHVKQKSSGT